MTLLKFLILVLAVAAVSAAKLRFDQHRVYRIKIDNDAQLHMLQKLETNPDSGYYFFESPLVTSSEIAIVVPPIQLPDFERLVDHFFIRNELWMEDFQKVIDQEQPEVMPRADFGWTAYYRLANIYDWLRETANSSSITTFFTYGRSGQGRDLVGVKISAKAGNPIIFIEANIHAREWITHATVTWFINELLTSNNSQIVDLRQNYDWHILPLVNPDGYEYTHTTNRMWRKTRSAQGSCVGVDGNRNFDYAWMQNGGASNNPCSETFAGPRAFSEPETVAIRDYYATIGSKVNVYLSVHSYGQYLLHPWGHLTTAAPNKADLGAVAKAAVDALRVRYGTRYTYGSTREVLYAASGVSPDWAYGVYNTSLAYTYEMRDTGSNGFTLPASQIIPNALEWTDSLVAFVAEAKKLGYLNPK